MTTQEYANPELEEVVLPLDTTPGLVEAINNAAIRSFDKWLRMCFGRATELLNFDGYTATFEVQLVGSLSHRSLYESLISARSWKHYVKCLRDAQQYRIRVYVLKRGGTGGMAGLGLNPDCATKQEELEKIQEQLRLAQEEIRQPGYPVTVYEGDFAGNELVKVTEYPDGRTSFVPSPPEPVVPASHIQGGKPINGADDE